MMDYGFASYRRVTLLKTGDRLGKTVRVRLGMQDELEAAAGGGVSMLIRPGQEKQLSLEVELPEEVNAPIKQGDTLGVVRVLMNGEIIAKLPAVASEDAGMPGLLEGFVRLFANWR